MTGMSPLEAALKGASEVGFTVLSMSISLIAVFIPILLMGGIVGRLFREFAMTISIAIVISLAVSLATTPMMCAVLLRSDAGERTAGSIGPASASSTAMLNVYRRTLTVALQHPALGDADSGGASWGSISISTASSRRAFSRSRIPGG